MRMINFSGRLPLTVLVFAGRFLGAFFLTGVGLILMVYNLDYRSRIICAEVADGVGKMPYTCKDVFWMPEGRRSAENAALARKAELAAIEEKLNEPGLPGDDDASNALTMRVGDKPELSEQDFIGQIR